MSTESGHSERKCLNVDMMSSGTVLLVLTAHGFLLITQHHIRYGHHMIECGCGAAPSRPTGYGARELLPTGIHTPAKGCGVQALLEQVVALLITLGSEGWNTRWLQPC